MTDNKHYEQMTVQPWTVMEALLTPDEFIGFLKGNILKYSMRQGRKPGTDDGAKCLHYIEKLMEVQDELEGGWQELDKLQSILVKQVNKEDNHASNT